VRRRWFQTFRGYTKLRGTIPGWTVGNCLDAVPPGSLAFFDPRVPIQDGDIVLIALSAPIRGAKFVQKRFRHPALLGKYNRIESDNPPWTGELRPEHKPVGPLVAVWIPPKWLRRILDDEAATAETDKAAHEYAEKKRRRAAKPLGEPVTYD
jgi:hypothetical protein